MEPTFVDRAAFRIMGVYRVMPIEGDYSDLWENVFTPLHDEVRAHATEPHLYYCAYYEVGEPGMHGCLAGMAVRPDAQPGQGLEARDVPACQCAVAECAIAEIGPTWQAIFSQWLPASGYVPDEAAPAFEEFIEEGPSPEDTTVRVHLPLRRAGP